MYTVREVARLADVHETAVRGWLSRTARYHHDYVKRGRRFYITRRGLERYLNRLGVPTGKPLRGMRPVSEIAGILGVYDGVLRKHCYSGKAKCVRHHRILYAYLHEMRAVEESRRPPPGWEYSAEVARRYNTTAHSLNERLRRRDYEVRYVRGRSIVRTADVARIMMIPRDAVEIGVLAREFDVTRDAVTIWMKRNGKQLYRVSRPSGARATYVSAADAEAYRHRPQAHRRRPTRKR